MLLKTENKNKGDWSHAPTYELQCEEGHTVTNSGHLKNVYDR